MNTQVIYLNQRFQSTHPQGVRHECLKPYQDFELFQFTHPQGVRPIWQRWNNRHHGFQSTHPQGVRLTSAENATEREYFNPLTRKGWDMSALSLIKISNYFNPLTRKGWDSSDSKVMQGFSISIHSPARGETIMEYVIVVERWFQSTHPQGVRQFAFDEWKLKAQFQSTHPQGVRLKNSVSGVIPLSISIHSPARGETYLLP